MAKKKRKRIASRGSVNNIILKTLINGDKYGYEIIKEVEEFSDGKFKLKQPSLYSSLNRFEEKGFVTSYWGDSDIGGRRHYYHLTAKGKQYYDKEILKLDDCDDEIIEEDDIGINNAQVEEINNEAIEESTSSDKIEVTEVDDDSIPATINFEIKDNINSEIIPDHNFHNVTPMEEVISQNNSNYEDNMKETDTEYDESMIWKQLSDQVKLNNRKILNSPYKKLHYIKPKKSQKVILDTDGIYKLRDSDYVPSKKISNPKPKIIDNVGKRITNKNYGFAEYTEEKKQKSINIDELSSEERERRNQLFLEKFNSISQEKMKEVEPKPVTPPPSENIEKEIDYRSKLDIFKTVETNKQESEYNDSQFEQTNNLFNYVDDEETQDNFVEFDEEQEENNNFVNFESVDFDTKNQNKKYIEEINNFNSESEEIKISRYENKSTAILSDKQFVLINKVKCIFGIILLLLFLFELTVSYVIFKNNNLVFDSDKILFIVAYILVVLISLLFIVPIFINSNKHKLNNYNLKYSIIFGILTFLVSIVLVYCFNSLCGFEIDNFKYFAVKIIVPLILTLNFVITPPIYFALINSKKFYD